MSDICDDDDDDCVIFEGSPLYESLLQSGYDLKGEEVISSLKSELSSSDNKNFPIQIQSSKTWTKAIYTKVKRGILFLYNWILEAVLSTYNCKIQVQKSNLQILEKLKQCTSLVEEDADFMDWFIDTSHTGDCGASTKSRCRKWIHMAIVPVILSYSYLRIFNPWTSGNMTLVTDSVTVTFCIYLSTQAVLMVVNSFRESKYRQEILCVNGFLSGSEKFLVTLKKSLRLIQETELIARGFTLISQRNPLSRLEEGKRLTVRQCPALRKLLFTCSRDSIHRLRETTKLLLQLLPDNPEIDLRSGYLAYEPLENYGPCLQIWADDCGTDVAHIYGLTDGFSVSSLKSISHLMMLHLSEFIKGLAIFYHHDHKHTDLTHDPVLEILQMLVDDMTSWTGSVRRSIDFHNSSLIRKQSEERQVRETSIHEDLLVAIHSLDLHLQSALTRVRSLTTEIEKHDDHKDQSDGTSHDYMGEIMQPIKAELTSCNSCYSEALSRLEKLLGKSSPAEEGTPLPTNWKDNESAKDNIKEIEDYIIVDQVFEAYTDPDEIAMEDIEWENFLTPEEKERKRKEKEEATRMMSELKTVIKVRAKDTEKRETAALLRFKMVDKDAQVSDTENIAEEPVKTDVGKVLQNQSTTVSDRGDTGYDTVRMLTTKDEKVDTQRNKHADNMEVSKSLVRDLTMNNENPEDIPSMLEPESVTCKGNSQVTVPTIDELRSRDVVTKLGVRRLRKSTMLEDSDSDVEIIEDRQVDMVSKYPDSVIHGVRRERKSNILDDSDSDEEIPAERRNPLLSEHLDGDGTKNIGVWRQRKGTMLDDSDFDVDDTGNKPDSTNTITSVNYTEIDRVTNSKKENTEDDMDKKIQSSSTKLIDNADGRTDPIVSQTDDQFVHYKPEELFIGDSDDDNVNNEDEDVHSRDSLTGISLEEKLARYSGLDFCLTSNIAARAAAMSKDFVKLEETTFGGEEYGELSESESDEGS